MPERMKAFGRLKIVQTASWVPDQVIDNDDLSRIMDTSDDWIQSEPESSGGISASMRIRLIWHLKPVSALRKKRLAG